MSRRKPRYSSDSDYTTNAPSYYDDLARKNKLIQLLAEKIWDYEKKLDTSLENIKNVLDNYINIVDGKIELIDYKISEGFNQEINDLLVEWLEDGTLDHIINETIFNMKADKEYVDNELDSLRSQLGQIGDVVQDKISLEQFKNFVKTTNDTEDWTDALREGIIHASQGNKVLVMPNYPIRISSILIEGMSNIHIDFLEQSILLPIMGIEDHFLSFKNCENVTLSNYRADGENHYTRGLMFLEGNNNIYMNSVNIKNISPYITQDNPTFTNSIGLFIATHNNHNILIDHIVIDNVRNNNNGIIGDSLGSSRGVLFDSVNETTTIPCTNIRIKNVEITNVYSEDGDGIQFTGKPVKHDIVIDNVYTDNTERRSLKFQDIKGVRIKNHLAKHTDRSFHMAAGVSMYTDGNAIEKSHIDIRAIKGFEITSPHPYNFKTEIGDLTVYLTDEEIISGSRTYPLDIQGRNGHRIKDVVINNLNLTGANEGVIIRSYTKDVIIANVVVKPNGSNNTAIRIDETPDDSADQSSVDHINLVINNVVSEGNSIYAQSGVQFEGASFLNHFSRNGSNPYSLLAYHNNIKVSSREYISENMPTSGQYRRGDYVINTLPTRKWYNDLPGYILVKGWYRLTDGDEHEVGTDWVIDYVVIEKTS